MAQQAAQSPHRKECRQTSWAKGQAKHRANREANEARAEANRQLRLIGEPTAYERFRAARRARRDLARLKGTLAPIGTTQAQWIKSNKTGGKS